MKIFKKLLIVFVCLLGLLIAALFAVPYFFKDEIVEQVNIVLAEQLNAEVNYESIDLSLLSDFPNISLNIDNYLIKGVDEFNEVNLISGKAFDISMDLFSVYNFGEVPLEIRQIRLDEPNIHIIVLNDGKANYDIVKSSEETTSTESSPFKIDLQSYAIKNGKIIYDDRLSSTYVEMVGLNHEGQGDFTQDVFDLDTKTNIEEMTAASGGITYLKKSEINYDAGFNIDLSNAKYTLRENELKINELAIKTDGWLATPEDGSIDMDLSFSAPQSSFKSLLSMIPNAYIEGYEAVKAAGEFELVGSAKGKYIAESEKYPAFNANLKIANGDLKYPDLPIGISDINTSVSIKSPSSDLDKMLLDVSSFKLKIGDNPVEGFFKLKTPMSDPDVDTKIKGVLNLGDFIRAYPMEGVKTLNGEVKMDMVAKTKMSTIDREEYANVDMDGSASIENLNYITEDLPPVRIDAMRLFFTPKNLEVSNFDMRLGKSDLSGNGKIDNVLAYFSPNATMKGQFTLNSNYLFADEWMSEEEEAAPAVNTASATEEVVFDRFDFNFKSTIGKLDYDVYQIKDLNAAGHFTPAKLTADDLSGRMGDSDFAFSGVITNIWNYIFKNETLGGDLNMTAQYLNLNQFMTDESTTTTETTSEPVATEPFLVPAGMNIHMNAQIDKVLYDNIVLEDMEGGLNIADQAVQFEDVVAKTIGGKIAVKGGYDTKDQEKPQFDLGLQLADMDFQKAFSTFNTLAIIAPIGKFINGNFDTRFNMSSALGKDLMPDLSSLTSDGFLQTANGSVAAFGPLEAIANKLNIAAFKNFDLKNTKNWFTIKDGNLKLDEFDHSYQDIAMKIGGNHKITGPGTGMDYFIKAKIPRAKIGKNPLGAAANSGLDLLGSQASKLGLNIDAGEFVNVQIGIGGSIEDPKITVKLLGTEGSSNAVKDAVVNSVKAEADILIDEAKKEATNKLNEEKAKLEAQAKAKADKVAKDLADQAKKKLEDEAKKRLEDEARKKLEEEAKKKLGEDAKKKLEDWNPFKKKKEGGR